MKVLVAALCLALTSPAVFATEFWVPAIYIGSQRSRDPVVIQCVYRTVGGRQVALKSRGLCALSVLVNSDNGQTRQSGAQRRPRPR